MAKPWSEIVHKHKHEWDLVAETTQANHYWCEKCGAYKRHAHDAEKATVHLPVGVKK